MIDWALMGDHLLDGYSNDFDNNFKLTRYPQGVFAPFYISEFKSIMNKFDIELLHNVATDGFTHHVKDKIDSLSKPILNLGVSIRVVDEPLAKQLNLEEGLYVVEVNEYSPAEKAGLKSGDLIVKADGTRIKTFEELQEIKNSKEEGDTINIEFIRDGKTKNTTITLTSTSSTSSSESTTN